LSTRRAAWLSVAWLAAGLAVALPLAGLGGGDRTVSYLAVYVVERTLSLDNVFIFLLILDFFVVPKPYRRRVVLWAIALALVVRAGAIVVGAALIERFDFVTYVLGALLLVVAIRTLSSRDDAADFENGLSVRALRRVVPLTRDSEGGRFLLRRDGRRAITPLGLALFALVAADITFAVDSIPAAFGITTDAAVIWLANALALAGLVPLLVLVRALVRRFRFMPQTLAAVLIFIALRLLLEHVITIGPIVSLVVIAALLIAGVLVSLAADRRAPPSGAARDERRPPRCPPAVIAPDASRLGET
jgi:tellurite resistance protein TerC